MKTQSILLTIVFLLTPWFVGCADKPDDNRPDYFDRRPVYNDSGTGQRQFESDR